MGEEATGLGVAALVLREVTERPEGVQTGALRLVGTNRARIVAEASRLLDDRVEYEVMANAENPFGDGHAAERIVASLLHDAEPSRRDFDTGENDFRTGGCHCAAERGTDACSNGAARAKRAAESLCLRRLGRPGRPLAD